MINFREILPLRYYGAFLRSIFLILIYFKPDFLKLFLGFKDRTSRVSKPPCHFIHKTQLERIKDALEIYYLEKGSIRSHIEELISAELLQKSDLFYRKGISYQIRIEGRKIFFETLRAYDSLYLFSQHFLDWS